MGETLPAQLTIKTNYKGQSVGNRFLSIVSYWDGDLVVEASVRPGEHVTLPPHVYELKKFLDYDSWRIEGRRIVVTKGEEEFYVPSGSAAQDAGTKAAGFFGSLGRSEDGSGSLW